MENKQNVLLSSTMYDTLKFVALIVLPALGTFYFALSQIWGLPFGEEITGTINAMVVMLGAMLQISTNQYNKTKSQE